MPDQEQTPDSILLELLADPKVGDINLTKSPDVLHISLGRVRKYAAHVLARDGFQHHCAEFDTPAEFLKLGPALKQAVKDWPDEARYPPGSV